MDTKNLNEIISQKNKDHDYLVSLFDAWWSIWPTGQRTAKKQAYKMWEKVFLRELSIPKEGWGEFAKVLNDGLQAQLNYRSAVFEKYPDAEERKRKDVFIPRMPMPSTWINNGRWSDPVPKLGEEKTKVKQTCSECPDDSTVIVQEVHYCAWHWTKKFNKAGLKTLYDSLSRQGLEKKENESKLEWSDRCRRSLKQSEWGEIFGA